MNSSGQQLCHGSIIDFHKRPARLVPDEPLLFWLNVRGVRNNFEDRKAILARVQKLLDHHQTPPPLPRMLLRGNGGYVAFEVISPIGAKVTWLEGNDALKAVREKVPDLDDSVFTALFGKRNASRMRCLKHLKSGSFNIKELKVSFDMKRNLNPDDNLMVIKATSAPSQRLGRGDMYCLRIALKKNEDNTYMFLPAPDSRCDCPVGMFFCTHRGGFLLLLHVISKYHAWDLDILTDILPKPIHVTAALPVPVSYAFPRINSNESEQVIEVKQQAFKEIRALWARVDDDDQTNDVDENATTLLANPGMAPVSVLDVSSGFTIPVCQLIELWVEEMKASELIRGYTQKICSSNIEDDFVARAKPNSCEQFQKLQLKRLRSIHTLSEEFKDRRSILSLYTKLNIEKIENKLAELKEVDGTFKCPGLKYGRKK